MKRIVRLILLAAPLFAWQALAQGPAKDPLAEASKVLERAVQDFEKTPNAAATARSNIAAQAKAAAAAAKASAPAPPPAPLVAPPPTTPAPAMTTVAPATPPVRSFAEMEQLYLDGKISAKAFQTYLRGMKIKPTLAPAPPPPTNAVATVTDTNAPTLSRPADTSGTMNDIERRLDELIRAQEAREKAATNQLTAPAVAKTKRQKLDELLKQLLDGKVTEEEYKARREKILAEPD